MPDEKWVECIHKEIDGLNSPEESSNLRSYLKSHPEEQKLYDDLMHLTGLMKNVVREDQSPKLRDNILKEIPYNMYPHYKLSFTASLVNKVTDLLTPGPALKLSLQYAAAFAAGFVLCMMLFFAYEHKVHQNLFTDSTYMQGAMGVPADPGPFEEADRADIDLPSVRGEIKIYYSTNLVQARLDLQSAGTVEAEIGFDKNDLAFSGWRQLETSVNSHIESDDNKVRLSHDGHQNYWLIFANKTPDVSRLTLKLYKEGSTAYEASFQTGARPK